MKLITLAALAALGVAVSGCASIVEGTTQNFAVNTTPKDGAKCTLSNSEGTWYVTTPGNAQVHKTKHNLEITCTLAGYKDAHTTVESHFNGATVGNVLAGGLIGVGVDAATGANFNYPANATLAMDPTDATPVAAAGRFCRAGDGNRTRRVGEACELTGRLDAIWNPAPTIAKMGEFRVGVRRLGLLCFSLAAAAFLASSPACAAGDKTLRNAGNVLLVALPVAAVGVSLAHDGDWKGLGQFALAAGLTVGSAYALRAAVRIQRPDHSDFNSFSPPDVALADSSASYLWQRYGWKYGVPAYAARAVVSYALSDAKKNHWYDTLAASALSFGFNYALVTRYHPKRSYQMSVDPEPGGGASVHFTMNF